MASRDSFKDINLFFSKWLFLGIILILGSIIINAYENAYYDTIEKNGYATPIVINLINVISSLVSTLGISIFIGSIFSWILGSRKFAIYIKDKIVNVLVTKDYIGELDNAKKISMLESLLKPQKSISNIYSRIDDYFKKHVDDSVGLFQQKQFRSNLQIIGTAFIENDIVCVKYRISYRNYVVEGEHENLQVGFDNGTSKVLMTKVALPDNKPVDLETVHMDKANGNGFLKDDCATTDVYEAVLPNDSYKKARFLKVEREIVETGADHWNNFSYRSSKPTDGMELSINCMDNLVVKSVITYGPMAGFNIDMDENDPTKVSVSCNEWMNPGYGINILFAKK